MANLLYCEFLKLKRSKMFLISIIGGMVSPLMVFAGLLKYKIRQPEMVITYEEMLEQNNLYVLMLFGLVLYGVIAAYLFSREYTENTLKSILTIPVSKSTFLMAKFFMFFVWMMILTAVAWGGTLILGILGNAGELSVEILLGSLQQYFVGATLLYFVMSPFVFITLWLKSLIPTVIATAAMSLGNVAISNEDLAVYFPWASPLLIASGDIAAYEAGLETALVVMAVTSLVGFIASFVYFGKQDVK